MRGKTILCSLVGIVKSHQAFFIIKWAIYYLHEACFFSPFPFGVRSFFLLTGCICQYQPAPFCKHYEPTYLFFAINSTIFLDNISHDKPCVIWPGLFNIIVTASIQGKTVRRNNFFTVYSQRKELIWNIRIQSCFENLSLWTFFPPLDLYYQDNCLYFLLCFIMKTKMRWFSKEQWKTLSFFYI